MYNLLLISAVRPHTIGVSLWQLQSSLLFFINNNNKPSKRTRYDVNEADISKRKINFQNL